MKVMAFNCSPRGKNGNTDLVLNPFLEGTRDAGADTEVFYTNDLTIGACKGDLNCLLRTPGECFQKDDMQVLLPKLRASAIWVFATPVQIDGISSAMKIMMERMLPLVEPLVELREGHCRYRLREDTSKGKIILVSTCGNWEMDNFDPLLSHMDAASRNIGRTFEKPVLRPHASILKPMIMAGTQPEDIFLAAKELGRQIIREGSFRKDTLDIVSRPILPMEEYIKSYNFDVQRILKR